MVRPPPNLSLSSWADKYRVLSRETSAEPGRFRTSRTPFMRKPMDSFTDPKVERVVVMSASQTAKTECMVWNPVGYVLDCDPGPILIVDPREADSKKNSKKRLTPMLRDCPSLRGKVAEGKGNTRDSSNTILEKVGAGFSIILAGANAPAGLANDPIRYLFLNEVSRFPLSSGAEGDPVEIAEKRTTTFSNRKILANSSPTDEDSCRISAMYKQSDAQVYVVPCPHCDHGQVLRWMQIRWERDKEGVSIPETARYFCEKCNEPWTDGERIEAVERADQRESEGYGWVATQPFNGTAGFHIPVFLAPWSNVMMPELVKEWDRAQGYPLQLKTFINTRLAETWKEKYMGVSVDSPNERTEPYPTTPEGLIMAPVEVAVMTAGVDVQDDRLEVQIVGFGKDFEQWKIQYHVIAGDPSAQGVWDELWNLLIKPIPMARGGVDYVRATVVDTGYHAIRAYEFVRPRQRVTLPDGALAYVFGVKAYSGPGDVWPKQATRTNKGKIDLYSIKVDPLKESLYGALSKIQEPGPGYIHFPHPVKQKAPTERDFSDDYFKQLTSEKRHDTYDKNGRPKYEWQLKSPGARNEALDTHNYAEAAFHGLVRMGIDIDREAHAASLLAAAYEAAKKAKPDEGSARKKVIRKGRGPTGSSYLSRRNN